MSTATQSIHSSLAMLNAMTDANLTDVTAALAEIRPTPDGNNTRWVLGHIVFWRSRMLEMLGGQPVWAQGEHPEFEGVQKGDPPREVGVAWDALLDDLGESRSRLTDALEGGVPDAVRDDLHSLTLHEAYHVGQLGLLRRTMGLRGAIGG